MGDRLIYRGPQANPAVRSREFGNLLDHPACPSARASEQHRSMLHMHSFFQLTTWSHLTIEPVLKSNTPGAFILVDNRSDPADCFYPIGSHFSIPMIGMIVDVRLISVDPSACFRARAFDAFDLAPIPKPTNPNILSALTILGDGFSHQLDETQPARITLCGLNIEVSFRFTADAVRNRLSWDPTNENGHGRPPIDLGPVLKSIQTRSHVSLDASQTVSKFVAAMEFLKNQPPKLLIGPDIIFDQNVQSGGETDLVALLQQSPDRADGFNPVLKGGGHAYFAVAAAATFAGHSTVEVVPFATVYASDAPVLVGEFWGSYLASTQKVPTHLIFTIAEGHSTPSIVIENHGRTTILKGSHPKLDLKRLSDAELARLNDAMRSVDLIAPLSVKSPSFGQMIEILAADGSQAEILTDCSSCNCFSKDFAILDQFRRQNARGHSPITLLSINSNEAKLFAGLFEAEKAGRREDLIAGRMTDAEFKATLEADGISAAVKLNEALGIPLLYHSSKGAMIIDKTGARSTAFIPSVVLDPQPEHFLGAGDTLCGGISIALALKAKSDKLGGPVISYDECVLLGLLVTSYRLEAMTRTHHAGKSDEWYATYPTSPQLVEWARHVKAQEVVNIPQDHIARLI